MQQAIKKTTVDENTFTATVLPVLLLVENGVEKKVKFYAHNTALIFEKLKTCYDSYLVAAGGLVKNRNGKLLVIFRNGKWDLPKGKVEKNESCAEGALREVREETGLKKLQLISEFQRTHHTYIQNDKRILKQTVWYLMQAEDNTTVPQTEEGITQVEWITSSDSATVFANTHESILLLLKNFFSPEKKSTA